MQKFSQFITETISYDQIIKAIKLNNLNGPFLWRGVTFKLDDDFGLKKVRKDRESLSNYSYHYEFNELFFKKFKSKLRSEAVFCVKNQHLAADYGTPVIVIPKDKAKFYHSPFVKDLITFDKIKLNLQNNEILKDKKTIEEKLQAIVDTYIEYSDISKIKDNNEIMILCNEYYYINVENMPYMHTYEDLVDYLEENNV
jgi:hypothetical protein